MFRFAPQRISRKPSLTPMIDVVFLLLVFFMLASQFGRENALSMGSPAGAGTYTGAPRLVDIGVSDLRLNGTVVAEASLLDQLRPLVQSTNDTIVLRAGPRTDVQRLIDVAQRLRQAGFGQLAVVE